MLQCPPDSRQKNTPHIIEMAVYLAVNPNVSNKGIQW